jgi:hypothetical protein
MRGRTKHPTLCCSRWAPAPAPRSTARLVGTPLLLAPAPRPRDHHARLLRLESQQLVSYACASAGCLPTVAGGRRCRRLAAAMHSSNACLALDTCDVPCAFPSNLSLLTSGRMQWQWLVFSYRYQCLTSNIT